MWERGEGLREICVTAAGADSVGVLPALPSPSAELLAEEGWWARCHRAPRLGGRAVCEESISSSCMGLGLYWLTKSPKLHRTLMSGSRVAEVAKGHP